MQLSDKRTTLTQRGNKVISEKVIANRVNALQNGQIELFTGREIGRPYQGIFIKKNERGGLYTMSQCGDWLGDDNTKNDVIEFVTKQAK